MIYILSFLLALSSAWAADDVCASIELDQDPQGLQQIPAWSQGASNLCFAYTAAQMIDAYRFRHGDKNAAFLTSPLMLALKTVEKYKSRGSHYQGGRVEHAFSTAREVGTCNAKNIPDKLGRYSVDVLVKTLGQFHSKSQQTQGSKLQVAEEVFKFLHSSGVKNDQLPGSGEIEKYIQLEKEEFIAKTLSHTCKDSRKIEDLPLQKTLFQPRRKLEVISERLHSLLNARTPVGINFCSNAVTDPSHKGYWDGQNWVCIGKKNHSALVAGRKMIQGQCHFLVRDSACRTYPNLPTKECEDGQYWISSEKLLANLEGIYWLD